MKCSQPALTHACGDLAVPTRVLLEPRGWCEQGRAHTATHMGSTPSLQHRGNSFFHRLQPWFTTCLYSPLLLLLPRTLRLHVSSKHWQLASATALSRASSTPRVGAKDLHLSTLWSCSRCLNPPNADPPPTLCDELFTLLLLCWCRQRVGHWGLALQRQ